MSIIIGFNLKSSYDCNKCHSKCCSGEFDLTISKKEAEIYKSQFPESIPFISTDKITDEKKKIILQRSDSCIFLNNNGDCRIHSQKPQVCRVYPLVFWKISDNQVLSYIFPCRGLGFDWYSPKTKFNENKIKEIYNSINNEFNDYYAEYIDEYNPYESIDLNRVKKEQILHKEKITNSTYWNQIKNNELKDNFSKTIDELEKLANIIFGNKVENTLDVSNYIESALHWLAFNPNSLVFSYEESILIRIFASVWNKELSLRVPKQSKEIDHLLSNQIAWNVIAVATQDFWYNFDIRFLSQVKTEKYQHLQEFVQQMIDATDEIDDIDEN